MSQINKINKTVHLSFKDILLYYDGPASTILSRKDPDISSIVIDDWKIDVPILSAPMDSITTAEMALAMHEAGGLGIHTRFIGDLEENAKQVKAVQSLKKANVNPVACAIGVKNDVQKDAQKLLDVGADILCVDIANGNHVLMQRALAELVNLKDHYSFSIMAGNVATPEAVKKLARWGASSIKIGVGAGACCSTRRVTGFGVPQFTAVLQCSEAAKSIKNRSIRIVADGGIRNSGDVIKAIWSGADTVMCGYALAGHTECPTFEQGKIYRGMASRAVSQRNDIASEGVAVQIENKGSVKQLIMEYANAIRTACSMANARNLEELRQNAKASRVSTLTDVESEPVNEIS